MKRKPPGTPKNVKTVKLPFLQSPTRLDRKHTSVLGLSGREVRIILPTDLKKFRNRQQKCLANRDDHFEVDSFKIK